MIEHKNKKGMEQSMWIVVAAVIFLIILAVILYIVLKGVGPVSTIQTCEGKGGTCVKGISGCPADTSPVGLCSKSDKDYQTACGSSLSCVCCVPNSK